MIRSISLITSICLASFLLVSCVTSEKQPSPVAPSLASCVLLLGGGGQVFPDTKIANTWFKINSKVATELTANLKLKGYRIEPLIIDIRNEQERFVALFEAMNRTSCDKVIQVSHKFSGEPETPNLIHYFTFEVSVLKIAKRIPVATGMSYALASEYQNDYRFPMTSEVMDALSLSDLAAKMANGIQQAKIIDRYR
jgi:hypothetical protein